MPLKKLTKLLKFETILTGKKVFVTGHTGFTGSWACFWLKSIGCQVYGYSLIPDTTPSLYRVLGLEQYVDSIYGDINNGQELTKCVSEIKPDIILHLAAQPLVRRSYSDPLLTFSTNIMGTANLLEAARLTGSVKGVLCITTDKVYKNKEWPWPYRENDRLGGKDPYSASKAASEMIIDCYRLSFGQTHKNQFNIATARGGNIVGGGDWSEDRLIPDFVRAVTSGGEIVLRYPDATRPWQYVLALVQGYLMIMAGLLESPDDYAKAWNLGPHDKKNLSVREIFEVLSNNWSRPDITYMKSPLPESSSLMLDSTLARNHINWITPWGVIKIIEETSAWYKCYYANKELIRGFTFQQLMSWRDQLFKH